MEKVPISPSEIARLAPRSCAKLRSLVTRPVSMPRSGVLINGSIGESRLTDSCAPFQTALFPDLIWRHPGWRSWHRKPTKLAAVVARRTFVTRSNACRDLSEIAAMSHFGHGDADLRSPRDRIVGGSVLRIAG